MLMPQQAVQKNINIGNKIMAPAKRAVFAVLTGVLSMYSRDKEQALLSVRQLNRLYIRIFLFSAKSLCTEQNQSHKALELNHNLICLWYKWALTYYLIMGFSTKPVFITTLQSTFLCRSADPTLWLLWDGLYDLSGLLKLMISQGGKGKAGATTGTCHQSLARDLGQQYQSRLEGERNILIRSLFLRRSSRGIPESRPGSLHLNFNSCLKPNGSTRTHKQANSRSVAQLPKRKHIFQENWLMNP